MTLPGSPDALDTPAGQTLVTVSELHRLTELLHCPYEIDAQCDSDGFWFVTFTIAERRYVLATVRGRTRRWRQLEPVLAFLHEHCRHPGAIRLYTASWLFCGAGLPGDKVLLA
ncbi:hypothetical protein [Cupriavidus necator]|uniref:hypothetical protein n=1 Tax=Cupriavidus necator TaxID=106590 RepID=UPI00339DA255